jgi:hypothetical protein
VRDPVGASFCVGTEVDAAWGEDCIGVRLFSSSSGRRLGILSGLVHAHSFLDTASCQSMRKTLVKILSPEPRSILNVD